MLIYDNFMLINVKKKMFFIGRTDGRTDTRTTQNYSSEPHKTLYPKKQRLVVNSITYY